MTSRIDLELDTLLQSQDLTNILDQFNKPNGPIYNIFVNNIDLLRTNSSLVRYNISAWDFNPEKFCVDYYKNENLAQVVMLTNGIRSRFEFLPKNFTNAEIIAPFIDDIYKLLSFR